MEILEATETDIPKIVALLKVSLGESLMPKSERYWQWKHMENPFGPSPVLLCLEKSELIGVRAFMRWQWKGQTQIFSAVRAVDTATHPDHQGKGIFKKLTLSLVDYCKQRGDHFVFNTPNEQSKPGYLKMGWEVAGKLPIRLTLQRPFSIARNFITKSHSVIDGENTDLKYYLHHPYLDSLIGQNRQQAGSMLTNTSVEYLKWRYLDVPVARYVAIGEESGQKLTGLIIGRIKESRLGRELRITDIFLSHHDDGNGLIKKLKEVKKEWKIDYTTSTGTAPSLRKTGLNLKAAIGPVVTIRTLSMEDLAMLRNFNQWSPSLGDLELF